MPDLSNDKILDGRAAVDAYRLAHNALHSQPWRRTVPEEHTPLLNIMLKKLRALGFNTIQEFFDDNKIVNVQELGFDSVEYFDIKVKEDSTSRIETSTETDEEIEIVELTPKGKALLSSLNVMWR
jgi:hypothetical protein